MTESIRLVSFLGIGNYASTEYYLSEQPEQPGVKTPYAARALSELLRSDETVILATHAAEQKHGAQLVDAFSGAGLEIPKIERISEGRSPDEMWCNFAILRACLKAPAGSTVVLDITHGFRSLPFFAAAVVGFSNAVSPEPLDVRILYGAYDARDQERERSPIWDLTAFTELIQWSDAIGQLLKTGDGRSAAVRTEQIGRDLARKWARNRERPQPRVREFAGAMRDFSEALITLRVGELLLERKKGDKPKHGPARIAALLDELTRSREDLTQHAPPIAEVLDRLQQMLSPLVPDADDLSSVQAHGVMARLARLYFDLGRYAESAVVMREAWVNRYANPDVTRPGTPACSTAARMEAEQRWQQHHADQQRTIADVRNDIEHAGFRCDPKPPDTLREQLAKAIEALEEAVGSQGPDHPTEPSIGEHGTTYLVTRHPGAREWVEREGIAVDRIVDHLDPTQVKAGDVVTGSLPVNLAAQVCAAGGRYLHLSLDLPPELRGKELSVEDMREVRARIEEYSVHRVDSAEERQGGPITVSSVV